jgi:predicted transcriptional regulator|tara:strand:- start:31 stop:444 length:414 start_codon:yes stop_codon:yes gene_type:complete
MKTRQTSIDCYNQIKSEGLLSNMRFRVYSALLAMGKPSTTREVYATMNIIKQEATRFTELRKLGVIYEVQNRTCTVTGRTSIEWDLTDKLPVNVKNTNKTKKQRINDALNLLRVLYKNKNTSTNKDWTKVADLIKSI